MARKSRANIKTSQYLGIGAVVFMVIFLFLLPFYLGPDDLQTCGQTPNNVSLNPDCHTADAIVAISGGDTRARTGEAIKLYQSGWAPKLIFSGAAQDKSGPSNAEAMKKQAISSGVSESSILTEELAVNTQENAANTQTLIRSNNLKRIILVTSAYHQKRASLEFQKRAGKGIAVINHPVKNDKQWRKNWYLTPAGWWLATSELVKVIGFYVSGS